MTMQQIGTWALTIGGVVTALSLLFELVTGTAFMRGIGNYARREQPKKYWGAIALKVFVLLAIGAVLMTMRRG